MCLSIGDNTEECTKLYGETEKIIISSMQWIQRRLHKGGCIWDDSRRMDRKVLGEGQGNQGKRNSMFRVIRATASPEESSLWFMPPGIHALCSLLSYWKRLSCGTSTILPQSLCVTSKVRSSKTLWCLSRTYLDFTLWGSYSAVVRLTQPKKMPQEEKLRPLTTTRTRWECHLGSRFSSPDKCSESWDLPDILLATLWETSN